MKEPVAEDMRTVRVLVSGRVQGVWFRDWTRKTALQLGLSGWVRNRADGCVEALFSGTAQQVARMLEACNKGSPMSRIDEVAIVEEGGVSQPSGFTIRASV